MGQSLQKFTPGSEGKMAELKGELAQKYYDKHLSESSTKELKNWTSEDFYRAVCGAVEEINSNRGYTQFRVLEEDRLREIFYKHHKEVGKPLLREEFQSILSEVITETGFTGISAAKDILLYIFGVPATAFLIKQGLMPKAIPNAIFIPGITSATVFVLAKLNKL